MADARCTLDGVARCAEPAAQRLVWLLPPWDRARLRLTCRALAAAVPTEACYPTLTAMARAGGAALLRYDVPAPAGATLGKTHARVAVVSDNADALAWMEACGAFAWRTDPAHASWLVDESLAAGSARALRFALDRSGRRPDYGMLRQCRGGWSGALARELVAPLVAEPSSYAVGDIVETVEALGEIAIPTEVPLVVGALLDAWPRRPLPAAVAALALMAGLRARAEPADWEATCGIRLLGLALVGGALDLAERALAAGLWPGGASLDDALMHASYCARDAPAVLAWVRSRSSGVFRTSRIDCESLAFGAIEGDADAMLRWLVERDDDDDDDDDDGGGRLAPRSYHLYHAIDADSPRVVSFLVGALCVSPTKTLADALCSGSFATAEALAPLATPLDVTTFVDVALRCRWRARAMLLLRRHGLTPPPTRELLARCVADLGPAGRLAALAEAGYRVDGDLAQWTDSLRPHLAEPDLTDLSRAVYDGCQTALQTEQ